MAMDEMRLSRARAAMREAGLKALVCRLPENLVMLSGYWPVIGRSAVIVPAEADPVLLAPAVEREALSRAWVGDIRTFPVWKMDDPAPDASLEKLLASELRRLGLAAAGRRIGVDGGTEDVTPTQKILEPWGPAPSAYALVERALGDAAAVDATPVLAALRAVKTPLEIERIRVACTIGVEGLRAFVEAVAAGQRECDVAADVERAVMVHGTGHRGVRHARAQALVFSGTSRLEEFGWGFALTSDRRIERGDVVMLEMSVVADGYYADLTRVRSAGRADPEVRAAYEAVVAAYRAGLRAIRPGVSWRDVDAAARGVLVEAGYGPAFVHHTGHGLGLHYHEGIPFLHPDAGGVLEAGMITSVEPGVYGGKAGGLRLENDVLVTETGAEELTVFPFELD